MAVPASTLEKQKRAFQEKVSQSWGPLWFCSSPEMSRWILGAGIEFMPQPAAVIHLQLGAGSSAFLLDFLKIANPSLPFDRIVEADLEQLIQELVPEMDDYDGGSTESLRKWYAGGRARNSILVSLEGSGETEKGQRRGSLAALRMVAYYWNVGNLVVIDPGDSISGLQNTYTDPSGNEQYIFTVIRLPELEEI